MRVFEVLLMASPLVGLAGCNRPAWSCAGIAKITG